MTVSFYLKNQHEVNKMKYLVVLRTFCPSKKSSVFKTDWASLRNREFKTDFQNKVNIKFQRNPEFQPNSLN